MISSSLLECFCRIPSRTDLTVNEPLVTGLPTGFGAIKLLVRVLFIAFSFPLAIPVYSTEVSSLAQPHSPQFLPVFSMSFNFYALLLTCICAYPHFSTALSRAHQQSDMCFPLCLLPTFYSRFVNDLTLHIVFYS